MATRRRVARSRSRLTRGAISRTSRFGSSEEPLTIVAQKAHRIALIKQMKTAVKQASSGISKLLKNTYFPHVPLGAIYEIIERTGLAIPEDEKSCMLTGRQGRATWPLTFHGLAVPQHLWITWHKMEETGRYEVVGAIT
jgi:hypothetical protein